MKKLIFLFFCIVSFHCMLAQKTSLEDYPTGQEAYKGGNIQMFKDIQSFFVKNNLVGCENKKEIYWVLLRIDENSKPALIRKKADIERAEQNKCAYDLIVKALGGIKDWQPAQIEGEKMTAHFDFPFIPADFFENYKENYDTRNFITRASFPPNGIISFRQEIRKNLFAYIDHESYNPIGQFMVSFTIEKDGSTKVTDIEPKVKNSEQLMEDIKFAFKKIKQKWVPAKRNGIPVETNRRVGLNFKE
ncbi:hypothetical protein N6B72_06195 [Chryseobacterium soli]|uniref:energy transducer TonB n=1 Tax=Chryseobacterium soli TaxID=445961 RepID=UPI002953CA36|nr:hypothetical protein [Chryseobacterium soli]MDV7696508.1 hypothetical protein [Chryseobacterium soli]